MTGCEEAVVDGASDAGRDGHGGDDIEAGDVGDVSLVEGPARLGHQDEPIEAVLGREERPECEIARAPQDAQAALSARPRAERCFGHRAGVDDRERRFAGRLLCEDEPA